MKSIFYICACLILSLNGRCQYYLRGEIKDESNNPLANVKILLQSTGYVYYSGSSGGFGILLHQPADSLTFSADGFQPVRTKMDAAHYQYITLKKQIFKRHIPSPQNKLVSLTKNLSAEDWHGWTVGAETYSSLVENEFVATDKYPETGLTVNINKASYSNVRRFLNMGTLVPPDAIRMEEMLNNFNFGYVPPPADQDFSFYSYWSSCPWNANNSLLFVNLCARKADLDKVPASNLVFLIDVSGSMDLPNRLPLLKNAFSMLVNNLREKDTVSIVVYGGTVGVWLPPTGGREKKKILKSIGELEAGGPTPGEAGIRAAYRLAKSQFIKGGNNRVILATDGDFNVGQQTEDELETLITMHKQWGIYLTCLGVGMGNYKDSKLEVLAKRGNGNFAYLDDAKEAEKILMNEFAQTIYAVADNAFLDMQFDPKSVAQYRLIGFDNKLEAIADSSTEILGGEVGSGHALMALFELTGVKSSSMENSPSFLASAQLHYRLPHDTLQRTLHFQCPAEWTAFDRLPAPYRLAGSTVIFGGLLKRSKFMEGASWDDAILIAQQALDKEDTGQMEFLDLIEKAKKIYGKSRRRRVP